MAHVRWCKYANHIFISRDVPILLLASPHNRANSPKIIVSVQRLEVGGQELVIIHIGHLFLPNLLYVLFNLLRDRSV